MSPSQKQSYVLPLQVCSSYSDAPARSSSSRPLRPSLPHLLQLRDLRSIWAKLLQVLYPPRSGGIGSGSDLLKEWDLWGPLVICLALAIMLSLDVSSRGRPHIAVIPVLSS